jgi:hypothetical protein
VTSGTNEDKMRRGNSELNMLKKSTSRVKSEIDALRHLSAFS